MNACSCLTLILACIVNWQAREISQMAAAPDFPFDLDLITHVSQSSGRMLYSTARLRLTPPSSESAILRVHFYTNVVGTLIPARRPTPAAKETTPEQVRTFVASRGRCFPVQGKRGQCHRCRVLDHHRHPRSVRRRTLLQDVGGLTYPESDPGIPNSCFLVPHMDPNTLPLWGAVPREFSAAQTCMEQTLNPLIPGGRIPAFKRLVRPARAPSRSAALDAAGS